MKVHDLFAPSIRALQNKAFGRRKLEAYCGNPNFICICFENQIMIVTGLWHVGLGLIPIIIPFF